MAEANAAVAVDIAKSAFRYALAAAISCEIVSAVWRDALHKCASLHRRDALLTFSHTFYPALRTCSKHAMLARKSLREMSVCDSDKLTLEPVVVVENCCGLAPDGAARRGGNIGGQM